MSRTLVKSWPHREPLPEGREALERAIRLCERRARCADPSLAWPRDVCDHAGRGRSDELTALEDLAGWLPERYRDMWVAALRSELASLLAGGAP